MTRIRTDYDFVVSVEEDSEGVLLGISHGIGATECVLRPTQAERLAAELLAYANGDHKLPPDAIRPQRILVGSDRPDTYEEFRHRTDPPPWGRGLPE